MEEHRSGSEATTCQEEEEDEEGISEEKGVKEEEDDIPPAAHPLQVEIDRILEDAARKKNLSVMNVKSILRVSGRSYLITLITE